MARVDAGKAPSRRQECAEGPGLVVDEVAHGRRSLKRLLSP